MRHVWSLLIFVLTLAGSLGAYGGLTYVPSRAAREVAPGVMFSIEDLAADGSGRGRVFLARIKLDPAHVRLFVTPPENGAAEFPYRLAHTGAVARANKLTLAINATLFGQAPDSLVVPTRFQKYLRRAGTLAFNQETVLVGGKYVHLWEHSYMVGFKEDMTIEFPSKPPPADGPARWAIAVGNQGYCVVEGKVLPYDNLPLVHRTAVGLNPETRELFVAVFEHATTIRTAQELLARGATFAFNFDGSESSTLVLDGQVLTGDWRPVATHFGIAAH